MNPDDTDGYCYVLRQCVISTWHAAGVVRDVTTARSNDSRRQCLPTNRLRKSTQAHRRTSSETCIHTSPTLLDKANSRLHWIIYDYINLKLKHKIILSPISYAHKLFHMSNKLLHDRMICKWTCRGFVQSEWYVNGLEKVLYS